MHDIASSDSALASDWSPAERRAYERYLVDFHIRVYDEGGRTLYGEVIDISLGGMKLLSEHQVALGGVSVFRIDLAIENGFQRNMTFEATVDWVRRADDGKRFCLGLEFAQPTEEFLEVVQSIITALGS
jgi:c-di-GMP-binding flagellar brake protein YcgR